MNNRRVILTGTVWDGVAAAPPRRDSSKDSNRSNHSARPIISVEASPQPARSRRAPHGEPPAFSAPGVTLVGRLLLAHGTAIDVGRISGVGAEQARTLPFGVLAVVCGGFAMSGISYVLNGDPAFQTVKPTLTWLGIWLFTVVSLLSALRAFTASQCCNVVISTCDGHSHRIPLRGHEQARHLARALHRAMSLPVRCAG